MDQRSVLAENLRILRAKRNLTITDAASEIGITRETLRDLENGTRDPYPPTLARLAKGYNVSVRDLLSSSEELATEGKAKVQPADTAGAGQEIFFPLDIDQIRREVAGDNWANSWATLALQKAVEGEIERRYTDSERFEFKTQFDEIIDRLAPEKDTRFEEYAKAVEGFGYVSRVLERTAAKQLSSGE